MKLHHEAAVACMLAATLHAQIESGPKAGMQLTKVNVYAATGPHKGREFDAAAAIGQAPGALLFVRALNRETAPIIRSLDTLAADYGLLGFKSFTVMLTGDRTAGEERIRTVSNALDMRNPMTVSLDGAEGPGNYAINGDANLTLVMVKNGVVTKCLAFTDTGRKDVPAVKAAIEAVTGKLPATDAERMKLLPDDPARLKAMIAALWREKQRLEKQLGNLRNRRNRGMNRNRRGGERNEGEMRRQGRDMQGGQRRTQDGRRGGDTAKPSLPGAIPEDAELQGLLRRLIRAKTAEGIDEVFAGVDKAVGDDEKKQQSMVGGFRRILGATTYGTDGARARAKAWCEKHGAKDIVVKKKLVKQKDVEDEATEDEATEEKATEEKATDGKDRARRGKR